MKINIKYISKRFAALALVGSLALSSAGCGQNKKESTTNNGIENTIEDRFDDWQQRNYDIINYEMEVKNDLLKDEDVKKILIMCK